MHSKLENLPDRARLWIYAADREVPETDRSTILRDLAAFVDQWNFHGHPVRGAAAFVDGRFLILAADATDSEISGCGIDKSARVVEELGARHGFAWLPSLQVLFRSPATGQVTSMTRREFRAASSDGRLSRDTTVFDTSVTRLGDLRDGRFERRAADSWHAVLLPPSKSS